MKKEEILEILADWNFWEKNQNSGLPRTGYLKQINNISADVITAIIGVRRCGKSTILKQYIKEITEHGLERKNTLFVNFEDSRFTKLNLELLNKIYETYIQYLKPDKKPFIFLDEVQNIPGWERFARSINERGAARIFVTGSSSKLLSSELSTVLTGRYLQIETFPLDFKEFLNFKGVLIPEKKDKILKRIEIESFLNEYMEQGGFPEVTLSENKKDLLLRYFDDILQKDISVRYSIRETGKLKALARFYITNISSPITFNKVAKSLSIPLNTVERFSYALESAYLIFFLKRFSYSVKGQEKSPRKVYCIDTGLRNAVGFRFSENIGKIMENIVFLELLRHKSQNPSIELFYWKNRYGHEVDFVVNEGMSVSKLIQVCRNVDDYETQKREVRALLSAMKELKVNEGLIITEEYEESKTYDENKKILFKPLWKWLLNI